MSFRSGAVRILFFFVVGYAISCSPSFCQTPFGSHSALTSAKMPVTLEPNVGQVSEPIRYIARSKNFEVGLRPSGFDLSLANAGKSHSVLALAFAGSDPEASITAYELKKSESNYFTSRDSSGWYTHVPNFGRVTYRGVYPGIDVTFYARGERLEHDFVVAAGADYRAIRIRVTGADGISIRADGSVRLATHEGNVILRRPDVYQNSPQGERRLNGKFIRVSRNEIGFKVKGNNPSSELVIDPVLTYSTYIAGSGSETASAIAVDQAGNVYLTGLSQSSNFPTVAPLQSTCGSSTPCATAFLTKLNASGDAVFSTYLGGEGNDSTGIAVDANGNVIVCGAANSATFPLVNSFTTYTGFTNTYAFVLSVSADGSHLNYSSLLGRMITYGGGDMASVAVDESGEAYVTGQTGDTAFPMTTGVLGTTFPGAGHPASLFITKVGTDGTILYSTPVPGTAPSTGSSEAYANEFIPQGIAVDSSGDVYVGGYGGQGLPTTPSAMLAMFPSDPSSTGYYGFILKLNPSASAIIYATYLPYTSSVNSIALDSSGLAYVGGHPFVGFTATPGAFQTQILSGADCICGAGFVAHLNADGSAYRAATILTGTPDHSNGGSDIMSLGVDISGSVWVGGLTASSDFPLKNPIVGDFPSNNIAGFITELSGDLTSDIFSTFLNGQDGYFGTNSLYAAPAQQGVIWATGTTYDTDFPTTASSFEPSLPTLPTGALSIGHGFVSRVDSTIPAASPCLSATSLGFDPTLVNTNSAPRSISLQNCGNALLHVQNITFTTGYFSQTNTCASAIPIGGSCAINVTFAPTVAVLGGNNAGGIYSTMLISDDASFSPQMVHVVGTAITTFSVGPALSGSTTVTVQAGQAATYELAATGGAGYSGLVAVNCVQVPINYSCNVNNNSPFVQVQPGAATDFIVTLTPKSSAAGVFGSPRNRVTGVSCVVVLIAFSLFAFSTRKRANSRFRFFAGSLACIGLLASAAVVVGCGGSQSSSPPSPTQTYVAEITASDAVNSQTVPLTLNVK